MLHARSFSVRPEILHEAVLLRHLFAYVVTLMIAVIIARMTLGPVGDVRPPFAHFDKVVHAAAFACLALPLSMTRTHSWTVIFLVGCAYGGLIEVIQPHFGRTADWLDLGADAAGLLTGIALGSIASRSWRNR